MRKVVFCDEYCVIVLEPDLVMERCKMSSNGEFDGGVVCLDWFLLITNHQFQN